jgi:signal transduction histidine kinase
MQDPQNDNNKENLNSPISEIVTEIAHELRTPINSIMGFASLLSEDNLTSSQAEYVATLKENAYDLLSLLNDLIDLSKLEEKKEKNTFSEIRSV